MTNGEAIAYAWGVACKIRSAIDTARTERYPVFVLTSEESGLMTEALRDLDEAVHKVMLIQASLSERSKASGYDQPIRPSQVR